MNTNQDSSDPLFEQLLDEALGGPAPPDLSLRIIAELRAESRTREPASNVVQHQPVVNPNLSKHLQTKRHTAKVAQVPVALWASFAAMAALVLFLLYYVLSDGRPGESLMAGAGTASTNAEGASGAGNPGPHSTTDIASLNGQRLSPGTQEVASASTGQTPIEKTSPVTLDLPEFAAASSRDVETGSKFLAMPRDAIAVNFPAPPQALEDQKVIEQINLRLANFWVSEGIAAEVTVEPAVVIERLAKLFGTKENIETSSNAAALYAALKQPHVRDHLAQRLAVALLGRVGSRRVEPAQKDAFAKWLAPALSGQRWDETVAALIGSRGSSKLATEEFNPAAVWFASLAGPRSVPLVEQFGHAVLDVDLRCGRCHDHPLDGRIAQESYWQLNAVFETGLRWSSDEEGGLRVDSPKLTADLASPVVFYELPDGRQRSAAPRVLPAWIGQTQGTTRADKTAAVTEIEQLADSLHDNPQVARAAVNCVWEIVYGRPLIGSSANPAAPAENPELVQLHHELAEQFRAHDFNMGRLICWVASAQPMQLQVPRAILSPAFESASAQQLLAANHQLQNFAAFPLSMPQQEFGQLLAVVDLNQNPADLVEGKAKELLGQIGFEGSNGPSTSLFASNSSSKRPSEVDLLRASLETSTGGESVGLPAAWLSRLEGIAGYDLQSQHLYYLAGYWHPSARHMELAQSLRKNSDSDSRALSQLWWILANEKL